MKDAMYVTFPNYNVKTSAGTFPVGHGMVIAVDENTGRTRGSEYGRYDEAGKGTAHRVTVPDLRTKKPGNPSNEELDSYARRLYRSYKQWHPKNLGDKIKVHYVKGADAGRMTELMESAETNGGFYTNSDYQVTHHNCGTYGADMIKKSMPWYRLSGFGPFSFGTPEGMAPYWGKTGVYKEEK